MKLTRFRKALAVAMVCSAAAMAIALAACQEQGASMDAGAGDDHVPESAASSLEKGEGEAQTASWESAGIRGSVGGRGEVDGWESPFEGLDRPVSEYEEVLPGVAEVPDHGRFLTRYIGVQFDGSYSDERIREVIAGEGFEELYYYRHKALGHVTAKLSLPDGVDLDGAAALLLAHEEVNHVNVLGYEVGHAGAFAGRGALYAGDSPDSVVFDYGQYYLRASGFTQAYAHAKCNGSVTVAILDSGAPNQSITEAAANVDYANMYDATGGGIDTFGHGTRLASIVSALAGGDPAVDDPDIDGASWNATVLPVRIYTNGDFPRSVPVVGQIDLTALWDGFEYLLSLDEGDFPDVVNMSFGLDAGLFGMSSQDVDEMQAYIDSLVGEGAVCVAASGNDGDLLLGNAVHYPAACEGVVSVGDLDVWTPAAMNAGLTYDPVIAARSNTASDVDICAHGEAVKGIVASGSDGSYSVLPDDGTSYSAALVSSAAALVRVSHPSWQPADIEAALEGGAVKVSGMNGQSRTDAYGYGALDVAASVGWMPSGGSPNTGGSVAEMYMGSR